MDKGGTRAGGDDKVRPSEGVQDVFDLPTHLPRNFDFSKLSMSDYLYILDMAKGEIEKEKSK